MVVNIDRLLNLLLILTCVIIVLVVAYIIHILSLRKMSAFAKKQLNRPIMKVIVSLFATNLVFLMTMLPTDLLYGNEFKLRQNFGIHQHQSPKYHFNREHTQLKHTSLAEANPFAKNSEPSISSDTDLLASSKNKFLKFILDFVKMNDLPIGWIAFLSLAVFLILVSYLIFSQNLSKTSKKEKAKKVKTKGFMISFIIGIFMLSNLVGYLIWKRNLPSRLLKDRSLSIDIRENIMELQIESFTQFILYFNSGLMIICSRIYGICILRNGLVNFITFLLFSYYHQNPSHERKSSQKHNRRLQFLNSMKNELYFENQKSSSEISSILSSQLNLHSNQPHDKSTPSQNKNKVGDLLNSEISQSRQLTIIIGILIVLVCTCFIIYNIGIIFVNIIFDQIGVGGGFSFPNTMFCIFDLLLIRSKYQKYWFVGGLLITFSFSIFVIIFSFIKRKRSHHEINEKRQTHNTTHNTHKEHPSTHTIQDLLLIYIGIVLLLIEISSQAVRLFPVFMKKNSFSWFKFVQSVKLNFPYFGVLVILADLLNSGVFLYILSKRLKSSFSLTYSQLNSSPDILESKGRNYISAQRLYSSSSSEGDGELRIFALDEEKTYLLPHAIIQ